MSCSIDEVFICLWAMRTQKSEELAEKAGAVKIENAEDEKELSKQGRKTCYDFLAYPPRYSSYVALMGTHLFLILILRLSIGSKLLILHFG